MMNKLRNVKYTIQSITGISHKVLLLHQIYYMCDNKVMGFKFMIPCIVSLY